MACASLWRCLAWLWAWLCGCWSDPRASKRRRAGVERAAKGCADGNDDDDHDRQGLLCGAQRGSSSSSGVSRPPPGLGLLGRADDADDDLEAGGGRKPLLPPSSSGQQQHNSSRNIGVGIGPARVIVMRHGHRQDEADPVWHRSARRPWDPPLSAKGRAQAREAAGDRIRLSATGGGSAAATPVAGASASSAAGGDGVVLQGDMRPTVIITSPFLRCVQTSAGVAAALWGAGDGNEEQQRQLNDGAAGPRWYADWRFCEVLDARVLFGGRPDAAARAAGKAADEWMWGDSGAGSSGGSSTADPPSDRLAHAMSALLASEREAKQPLPRGVPLVPRPGHPAAWKPPDAAFTSGGNGGNNGGGETLAAALARYGRAIAGVMSDPSLRGETVLVVTHGEALRQAVAMMRPGAEVFEVRHTGFVVLEPRAAGVVAGEEEGGGDAASALPAATAAAATPSGSSGSSSTSASSSEEDEDEEADGDPGAAADREQQRLERQRQRRSARRRQRRRARREAEEEAAAAAVARAVDGPWAVRSPPGWRLATKAGEHGVMWFDA